MDRAANRRQCHVYKHTCVCVSAKVTLHILFPSFFLYLVSSHLRHLGWEEGNVLTFFVGWWWWQELHSSWIVPRWTVVCILPIPTTPHRNCGAPLSVQFSIISNVQNGCQFPINCTHFVRDPDDVFPFRFGSFHCFSLTPLKFPRFRVPFCRRRVMPVPVRWWSARKDKKIYTQTKKVLHETSNNFVYTRC